MKYLITGGAGFIGSNIVEFILRNGIGDVRVLDNFSTGKRENLKAFGKDIELIEGDIRSYHIVQEAVKGVDVILHQAALPSVPRSIKDPLTTNEVNIVGTLNILETAVKNDIKRIVTASSSSVYGNNPELPKHEGMTPNPLSPYAVSKLAGENYCKVFSQIYGLETVCLRYFNVFGPKQDPNSQYSAVIPKFIQLINNNQSPIIYGDGEQSRDFTYVENVINANILASKAEMKEKNLIMNCAAGERTTLNELINIINNLCNKEVKPIYEKERQGDVKHSHASIDYARLKIGYQPGYTIKTGLSSLLKSN